MNAINWKKGDLLNLTTTTAGAELVEIVATIRRSNGGQDVVLASPAVAAKIRNGEVDHKIAYLTGVGGTVRRIDTQYLHSLTARGLAVPAA